MLNIPFRRRPLIEELEPRLLFSADLVPLALDGLQPAPEQRVVNEAGEFSATSTQTLRHELVIVDTGVEDYQTLLSDILKQSEGNRSIEIITLDATRDGVEQLTEILRRQSNLDALHIISHGESGMLQLGIGELDNDSLQSRAEELAVWKTAFGDEADILLYGCDVASGSAGAHFVDALSKLTGADVAASTDKTGSKADSDWELEQQTGNIETGMLLGPVQTVWQGALSINPSTDQNAGNTSNPNAQDTTPSARQVAMHSDGSFVMVWSSNSQDGSGSGIYARHFDSNGNPQTGEILVNTTTSDDQMAPAIAMDANGNYVIVWQSSKQESGGGNSWGIFAQRFDSSGNKLESEIQVNATVSNDQTSPSIAMDAAGNFIVVWESNNQDGDGLGIYAQRFDSLGNKILTAGENEFLVNSTTGLNQSQPAVAMNASGAFVIAWTSEDIDSGTSDGVVARLFDSSGNTVKNEFKFHPLPANNQHSPDVAMNDNGEFVIALVDEFWGNPNVSAWLFDAAGNRQGIGAQLNQTSSGIQQNPSVVINSDGDFIAVWESQNQDGDGYGIVARHFKSDYSAYTDEQIINTVTVANQYAPSLSWEGSQAVFIWSGFGAEDSQGVYFRQAEIGTPPAITSDGGGSTANLSIAENTTSVTTVSATDSDIPSQTLTYSLTGGTDLAKFTINAATGVLSFIAAPDYETPGDSNTNNVYQVIVQVDDGHGGTDSQTINVTVSNTAPTPQDDSYTVSQDTALSVASGAGLLVNDSDPAGGSVTLLSATQPAHGTVSLVPAVITGFTNLTNNAAVDTRADWSPNGSKIAFDTDRNGNNEIYVMNADGTSLQRLTNQSADDSQAAWSPDGSKIAWMSNSSGKYEIWVMNADGSGKTRLTTTNGGAQVSGQLAWSPDGSKIAFTSSRTGSTGYDIYVMNADGSNVTKLTSASGDDSEPVWSPDGSKIAFYSNRDGNTEIYVMNADGSGQTRLTNSSGTDRSPVWSPDSSKIAFSSNRTGIYQIYMMDANGTNVVQVTNATTNVEFPDWSPNGSKLLFTHGNEIKTGNVVFDGSFIYTPDPGYSGADSFTYTVADPGGLTSTATVTINITPANAAPTTSPVTLAAIAEDSGARLITQAELLANANDANGDTLAAAGLAISSGSGTLVDNGNGTWTYTPALNNAGSISFSYTIEDGHGGSVAGSASLAITPVNDAPVATSDSTSGNEDTAITGNVLTNDTDVEGSALTAAVVTGPSHGSLTLNTDGSFTYTPAANWNGTDTFTYQANDGTDNSNIATVTITVASVNDAPDGTDKTLTLNEDSTYTFSTSDFGFSDPNDTPANSLNVVRITSLPAAGTLWIDDDPVSAGDNISATDIASGKLRFIPSANANGSNYASFTFQVRDNGGTANGGVRLDPTPNTITIHVTPVNDAPTAANANIDIPINLLYSGTLPAASDIDGDTVSYALGTPASHGVISVNTDGSYTYLPVLSYFGSDSFTYMVSDGNGGSNSYTVTINVGSINTAPVANDDTASGDEDTGVTGNVLDNDTDADGNPLTATLASGPSNGILAFNSDGSFVYTPNANWNGTDSFTYLAHDGAADSNMATVTLNVAAINDAPVAADDSAAGDEDSLITGSVLGNDTDIEGDALTAAVLSGPAHGNLTLNPDGSFSYTPHANWHGTDTFTYQANDGTDNSTAATVTITVNSLNDTPETSLVTLTPIAEDSGPRLITQAQLLANASDADGDTLTATGLAITSGSGTLVDNGNGTWTYTPALNDSTSVSFGYSISDGSLSTPGTASLDITPVNNSPLAGIYSFTTTEDTPYTGTLPAATDADGDPITYALAVPASHGIVSIATDGSFSYTPTGNFNGADSFSFSVSDGNGGSNSYSVDVSVSPVNDAPVGTDGVVSTNEDATYTFQVTDFAFSDPSDSPADNLQSVTIVSLPASGTLLYEGAPVLAGQVIDAFDIGLGELQFVPTVNENGMAYASFTFQIHDSGGIADGGIDTDPISRTLTINVTPVNDAPSTTGIADVTVGEDAPGTVIDLFAAFADAEDSDASLNYTIIANTNPSLFSAASIDGIAGTLTLAYNADAHGSSFITVRAADAGGLWMDSTFTVTVNPVNDAPAAANTNFSTPEDTAYSGSLPAATDADGDAVTYGLNSGASHGSVTVSAGGGFSYTPNANFNGSDSFAYTINDGHGGTATYTVTVNVAATNDAPTLSIGSLNVTQGETIVLNAGKLSASDVDNAVNELTYVVTALPAEGTLALNGTPLAVNDTFTQADVDAGLVSYTHAGATTAPDSLGIKVVDTASAESSGTLAITVSAPPPGLAEAGAPMPEPEPAPEPTAEPPVSETEAVAEEASAATGDLPTGSLTEDEDDKEKTGGFFEEDGENGFTETYRRANSLNPVQVAFNSHLLQNEAPATMPLLASLNRALDAIASDLNALESLKTSLGNNSFQQQLNQLQEEIRQQLNLDKNTVASTLAVSTGLSVGYVLWLVRGGVLLSSLLSSLPAWRLIDPLPILAHLNRQKHGDEDDDSLEGMLKKSANKARTPPKDQHAP